MAQQERFDWWVAKPVGRAVVRSTAKARPAVPAPRAVAAPPPAAPPPPPPAPVSTTDAAEVYRTVQASAAFQEIRRSYRGFVFPASAAFLGWYLLYLAAQTSAPELMRYRLAGPLNVAWLAGLLQFASTFLLTWLYARNARTKRDRAALGLRWDTQDQLR
ncbi:DUF485 domain-containing protein [Kitasatospora sp. MMS16-BH015]|uniref:DUF485 domain-containing protein n=1 Tax=Kitasatospora sp. MMS16-BH015 TaxID=2018025 RepID=UPI0020C2FEA2|nr:DUF485 domain-containing protein [Kitasatospora sp. MMS16-BH015]